MIAVGVVAAPFGVSVFEKVCRAMDVILKIGVDGAATARLQFLQANAEALARDGIAVWSPARLRYLAYGLKPSAALPHGCRRAEAARTRAIGRLRLNLAALREDGYQRLLICAPDLIGTLPENLRRGRLFATATQRMSRFISAFDGSVTRIVLNIQAPDAFWNNTFSQAVLRGAPMPDAALLKGIAQSRRSWRDVIADLARTAPGVELRVLAAERYTAQPIEALRDGAGVQTELNPDGFLAPSGPNLTDLRQALQDRGLSAEHLPKVSEPWQVFDEEQQAQLQEAYADDVFWLTAGADGLATYVEEDTLADDGKTRQQAMKRGQEDDGQQGHMGEDRRSRVTGQNA